MSTNVNQWTTIKTVGQEIHEGYNYIDFEANYDTATDTIASCMAKLVADNETPRFRYYRLYNENAGGC